jgi:hypothetical protein
VDQGGREKMRGLARGSLMASDGLAAARSSAKAGARVEDPHGGEVGGQRAGNRGWWLRLDGHAVGADWSTRGDAVGRGATLVARLGVHALVRVSEAVGWRLSSNDGGAGRHGG